jgi:hypothetical protein
MAPSKTTVRFVSNSVRDLGMGTSGGWDAWVFKLNVQRLAGIGQGGMFRRIFSGWQNPDSDEGFGEGLQFQLGHADPRGNSAGETCSTAWVANSLTQYVILTKLS